MLRLIGINAGSGALIAGAAFESIASATGTGSSGTITFSSIPSNYQHLQIRVFGVSTNTSQDTSTGIYVTFNGDSGTNYTRHALEGDGAGLYLTGSTGNSYIYVRSHALSTGGNIGGASVIDIHDYANTSKYTTLRAFGGADLNTTTNLRAFVGLFSGLWLNTSAVSSITIQSGGGNFATSSQFALYGIKAA